LEGNWWKGISTGKDHIRIWKAIGGNLKVFQEEGPYKILEGNWCKLEGISTGKDHIRFWKAIGGNLKVLPRGRTI
jgi:hypothetical protein